MLVRVLESRHFHIDDGWVTYLSAFMKISNAHPLDPEILILKIYLVDIFFTLAR